VRLARADDPGHQQAGTGGDLPPGSAAGGDGRLGDLPDPGQDLGVLGDRRSVARWHPGRQRVERGERLGLVGQFGDGCRGDTAGCQDARHAVPGDLSEGLRFTVMGAHHSSSA
jgi:hypothetical protein